MGFEVIGKPLDKNRGHNALIKFDGGQNHEKRMLSLSYYGNMIGCNISFESMICHSARHLIGI